MKIYRVAKTKYIDDLSGEGASIFGGRWNKIGNVLLYFSEYLSLSVLEILVHTDQQLITNNYWYIEMEIPDSEIITLKSNKLPYAWRTNPPISSTQILGSNWLMSHKSLALKVPSTVLPTESNILINPNHKHFSKVKIMHKSILDLDARVF